MKKSILFAPVLIAVFYLTSCDQKPTKKTSLTSENVVTKHDSLRSRVDSVWAIIDSNNQDLLFSINRMLQEIEWTNQVSIGDINIEREKAKSLKKYFYGQKTIPSSKQIDKDFPLVDSIVISILNFAAQTPDKERYGLINELSLDIQEHISPSSSFILGEYSQRVFDYNTFVLENKEALEKKGVDADPLPAFTEPNEKLEDGEVM